MEKTIEFLKTHKDRFLEELIELLKIPSVSADPAFSEDVFEAAEFIQEKLLEAGVDFAEIIPTEGHPIVFGQKIVDPQLPTVLVYGHYDVQPADPYELWSSPPFEPVIRDGKIYARGACDDKGQMYLHIKAFQALVATGTLSVNVKFLIEGEEEVGSVNLGPFLLQHQDKLQADVVIISDTSMIANDVPSITVGLRGLSYMEVEVTGPNRDLHSGVYGGGVANPINVLCKMIASLHDENKKVKIRGFYDDVVELTREERDEMARAPFNLENYKSELDLKEVEGETGYSTLERVSIRPTLDVNGIWGGYTGEGAKTVLPSKAYAKISMRLVPNQNSEKISRLFEEHFQKLAPESVVVKVRPHHGGNPVVTPTDSIAYQAACQAYETAFGKTPIPVRSGGSVPIVALFKDILGLDSIMMGFGLDSDNIHSPNENFGIFNYTIGMETVVWFYKHYATLSKKA